MKGRKEGSEGKFQKCGRGTETKDKDENERRRKAEEPEKKWKSREMERKRQKSREHVEPDRSRILQSSLEQNLRRCRRELITSRSNYISCFFEVVLSRAYLFYVTFFVF